MLPARHQPLHAALLTRLRDWTSSKISFTSTRSSAAMSGRRDAVQDAMVKGQSACRGGPGRREGRSATGKLKEGEMCMLRAVGGHGGDGEGAEIVGAAPAEHVKRPPTKVSRRIGQGSRATAHVAAEGTDLVERFVFVITEKGVQISAMGRFSGLRSARARPPFHRPTGVPR